MSGASPAPFDPTTDNVAGFVPGQGLRRIRRDLAITQLGIGSHTHAMYFSDSTGKGFNATAVAGRTVCERIRIEVKRRLGLNAGVIGARFAATNEYTPPQFTATGGTAWDQAIGAGDGGITIPVGGGGVINTTCAQVMVNYALTGGGGNWSLTDSLGAITIGPIASAGGTAGYKVATSAVGADANRNLTWSSAVAASHVTQCQFLNAAEAAAGTFLLWNASNFGGTNANHMTNISKYDLASTTTDVDVALCIHNTWQNYGASNYQQAVTELEQLINLIEANRITFNQKRVSHIITTPYPSNNLSLNTATILRQGAIGLARRLHSQGVDVAIVDVFNLLGDCTPAVDLTGRGYAFTDGSTHLIDKGYAVVANAIADVICGARA